MGQLPVLHLCHVGSVAARKQQPNPPGITPLPWGCLPQTTAVFTATAHARKATKPTGGRWGSEALGVALDWETLKLWRVHMFPGPPALALGSRRSQKSSKQEANTGFPHAPLPHMPRGQEKRPHLRRSSSSSLTAGNADGVRTVLLQRRRQQWVKPHDLPPAPRPHSPHLAAPTETPGNPSVGQTFGLLSSPSSAVAAQRPPCTLGTAARLRWRRRCRKLRALRSHRPTAPAPQEQRKPMVRGKSRAPTASTPHVSGERVSCKRRLHNGTSCPARLRTGS